jgi:hypothetical protein
MIHQLKLTILLLLVASISFAQQSVYNTSKSNTKDFAVADSVKVAPVPTVVKQTKYTTKTKAAVTQGIAEDLCAGCAKCPNCGTIADPTNPYTKNHNTKTCGTRDNVVNTTKSNIKDFAVADSVKKASLKKVSLESEITPAMMAGGPIAGTVIKGGKNPGASMVFNIPTKADGSFETKLEEGSYTISLDAEALKKTIAALKSKDETINGATFIFNLPANFTFSGTENANKKGEYVAPKYAFEITVPKEGILFAGKLLTSTTAGLSITPTLNEKGSGSPKNAGF